MKKVMIVDDNTLSSEVLSKILIGSFWTRKSSTWKTMGILP